MSTVIMILCFYGVFIGAIVGIVLACDGSASSIFAFGIAILCALGLYGLYNTDVQRHIVSQDTKERIGIVSEISGGKVKVDDKEYSRILEFSDVVKLDNIKLGDTVKVKFLDADFGNYIVKITEIDVKEKQ